MTKTTTLAALSIDFAAESTSGLVAHYNNMVADVGPQAGFKPVTRFADRKTAVARTSKLLAVRNELALKLAAAVAPKSTVANYVQGTCPKCGDSANGITCGQVVERKGQQVIVNEHQAMCHVCGHEFNYESGKALPKRGAAANPAGRAAAISASWADPEVFAARVTRHAVTYTTKKGTQQFKSVREAFEQLGLAMGTHIAFRGKLKAAGTLEGHGGTWAIVEAE